MPIPMPGIFIPCIPIIGFIPIPPMPMLPMFMLGIPPGIFIPFGMPISMFMFIIGMFDMSMAGLGPGLRRFMEEPFMPILRPIMRGPMLRGWSSSSSSSSSRRGPLP